MNVHGIDVRSTFRLLIDFVFPPLCASCGRSVQREGAVLCTCCHDAIARANQSDGVYREISDRLSMDGLIDGLAVPYYFEKGGPLQDLVHELKYGGMSRVGVALGEEIGRLVLVSQRVPRFDALIPIPLHRAKLRERGYNQAEYLCRGISHATGIPVSRMVVERCRYTTSQTSLSREERELNVRHAFRVRPDQAHRLYEGKILLVDDVITTGSTMRACAGALRASGVKTIYGASIAIAHQAM